MDTYNIVSEGNNWHSVSYLEDEGIITAQYSVPGVKEEDKENPEFKVLYVNKDSIPGKYGLSAQAVLHTMPII